MYIFVVIAVITILVGISLVIVEYFEVIQKEKELDKKEKAYKAEIEFLTQKVDEAELEKRINTEIKEIQKGIVIK